MDCKEFEIFEKAYENFLIKLRKKEKIEIKYYCLKGRILSYDFAFCGYETNDVGMHGIHYCKQKNQFYFGTRNLNIKSNIFTLSPGHELKISPILKQAFFEAATSKKKLIIRNDKRIDINGI